MSKIRELMEEPFVIMLSILLFANMIIGSGVGFACITSSMRDKNEYDLNRDGVVDEQDLVIIEEYCGKE